MALVTSDCQACLEKQTLVVPFLTGYVIHLAGDGIPSPVHIFPPKKNNPSVEKMSDLLIIYITVLCLQARANIVIIRREKAFEQCQLASAGVHSSFFFFLPLSGILIKYMQMTLSPLEKCKCSPL